MSLVCQTCPEVFVLVLLAWVVDAGGLLCYDGILTSLRYGDDPLAHGGAYEPAGVNITRLRCSMTIRCEDNAMCYVRSWSARSKHAWLVQRGCYKSRPDDPLPRTVRNPTRAMACKRERFRDAEYKVCLCQADWCNSAKTNARHRWLHFSGVVGIAASILTCYLYLFF